MLGVGLAVAMLFRRGDDAPLPLPNATVVAKAELPPLVMSTTAPVPTATLMEPQFSPQPPIPATTVSSVANAEPPGELPTMPVGAGPRVIAVDTGPSMAPAAGRPVYAVEGPSEVTPPDGESGYRVHVIHNGDTLERLAERYMSDGARALELFDLNRDVLENPHLLPLGVELRIPTGSAAGSVTN